MGLFVTPVLTSISPKAMELDLCRLHSLLRCEQLVPYMA